MSRALSVSLLVALAPSAPCSLPAADWEPAKGPLMTRWADGVSPENAHREYPRPQMVRAEWVNLNGLWDYAIRPDGEERPREFDGKILVPFAVESALSGVMKRVGEENLLWYHRTFELPSAPPGHHWLLHFGAVDWHATVWVNGVTIGEHRGGYDGFSFDITHALRDGAQELVVSAWDPSDRGYQPRGKQVRDPEGIWYTPVTGIWQTVWLEPVPPARIEKLRIVPDLDRGWVRVTARTAAADAARHAIVIEADVEGQTLRARGAPDAEIALEVPGARPWSPDSPTLYDLRVSLVERLGDARRIDSVESYFGMRKIALGKDEDGFIRLFLNGEPVFHFGPLDQGWWPDGLYTAPSDEALRYDVEVTRKVGFNVARKHVKVEPERWYYHCDRLGLMVWQDLPNGDRHIGGDDPDSVRSAQSARNFRRELRALVEGRGNHPSIVVWVPFNEGWGQFDTNPILAWVKELDPTRLVDGPSGWTDRGGGDLHDMHRYPGPAMPEPEATRAVVLGEFGGLGLPLEGHLWWNRRNWGYRTYTTRDELLQNYKLLMRKLHPLIGRGLAAAIYTQTTDVEGEVNGILTYDRAVVKLGVEELAGLHRKLYEPPPVIVHRTVVPTSEKEPQTWRFTTERPAEGWHAASFDDRAWTEGSGGFGEESTPGAIVRTSWTTGEIWLRRTFDLERTDLHNPHLRIHHDEDAEVYINGTRVAALRGFESGYVEVELDAEGRKALRKGRNTLAVRCRQTRGGQYIDVGIVEVIEKERPGRKESTR